MSVFNIVTPCTVYPRPRVYIYTNMKTKFLLSVTVVHLLTQHQPTSSGGIRFWLRGAVMSAKLESLGR